MVGLTQLGTEEATTIIANITLTIPPPALEVVVLHITTNNNQLASLLLRVPMGAM